MSKHTEGPWELSGVGDFIWILDENENYLAEIIAHDDEGRYIEDDEEREANAHLIAAAPTMKRHFELILELSNRNNYETYRAAVKELAETALQGI